MIYKDMVVDGSGKGWVGSIEVELCCTPRISCDIQDMK